MNEPTAKRKIKDSVFTNLFSEPEYLLKMYRALHPEDTETCAADLKIITLENILVNALYNDLGFIANGRLIMLVEAQATFSVNILYRLLLYFAKSLKEYIDSNAIDLYTTAKAELPKPEFYVIYTGNRIDKPDTISLSKEFYGTADIGVDVTAKMLYGDNADIIGEYVAFTKIYDEQRKIYGPTKQAIETTISICKDKNVLKEYLMRKEKEVLDMYTLLFDEEQIMKNHDGQLRRELTRQLEKKYEAEFEAKYQKDIAVRDASIASQAAEISALRAEIAQMSSARV